MFIIYFYYYIKIFSHNNYKDMKHFKLFAIALFIFCSADIFSQDEDFLTKNIDKSVNPGQDFFKYATGTWMKNNPIPESERAWGIGNLVQEETYARLKSILLEVASKNNKKGTSEQKVGDFYFSGMDTSQYREARDFSA